MFCQQHLIHFERLNFAFSQHSEPTKLFFLRRFTKALSTSIRKHCLLVQHPAGLIVIW